MSLPPAGRNPRWLTALVLFLAASSYFLVFHRLGFFLQDEGVLAYHAERVSRGEMPYADYQTAYTPAGDYLNAALFRVFGVDIAVLRASASIACATTAALLFLVAVRLVPPPYSYLPSLLYVVLIDQESGGLLAHTLPYPARYVTMLWALSLYLTILHRGRSRMLLPVFLGLVTAAITAFKHTAGIYNAWAVGICLILIGLGAPAPAERAPSRSATESLLAGLPCAFVLALLVSLPILFGGVNAADRGALLAFCVPILALAVIVLPATRPWALDPDRRRRLRDVGADLLRFGLAATVPTIAWIVYFGVEVGFGLLLQRLILDGPAVARSYAIPFPAPGRFAVPIVAVVLAGFAVAALARRAVIAPRTSLRLFGLALVLLLLAGCYWTTRLPWAVLEWEDAPLVITHVGRQLDNTAFYLAAIVAYAPLLGLVAWRRRGGMPGLLLVCWVHALCQLLLAYPRLDVAHLYEGEVTALVVGTVILERTVRRLRAAAAPARARWLNVALAAAIGTVVVIKLCPHVFSLVTWRSGPRLQHRVGLSTPRASLAATGASWLESLDRTIAYIHQRTPDGTPILTFPALAGVYFLSARDNPSEMDYFYEGFGEGSDELSVIDALERTRTPMVVMMPDYTFDPVHMGYFSMLKYYIGRHYRQAAAFPPFRVLERTRP